MNRTIVAGLAVTALLLSGCGGDDDSADADDATTTTEAEATTTEAEATTTEADDDSGLSGGGGTEPEAEEDAEPAAAATADGTVLAIGEPATVDYDATEGMISLEVTVDEVVESSRDELEAAGFDVADIEGFVPHFIRYSATLLSDVDVAGTGLNNEFDGITAEGGTGGTLITVGLDECRNESFSSDAAVGDTVEGCKVTLIPETGSIASVRWEGELTEGITWEL